MRKRFVGAFYVNNFDYFISASEINGSSAYSYLFLIEVASASEIEVNSSALYSVEAVVLKNHGFCGFLSSS